uniref:Uncharacterized protein n=1 Tax=Candidatus Kentrum sp. LFY TaxID=2126342 RepID=A0A450UIJ9_9GAMM|nr:MAG: hypothetical protein BECKLFY1418B_GA0070995_103412 [Candidatus Kentron sp. LFY]VFK00948.1 MAG: hypothetical protein BECKLFY1418A_GA0070994_11303 [Candidatus Kentron sp. LFY]
MQHEIHITISIVSSRKFDAVRNQDTMARRIQSNIESMGYSKRIPTTHPDRLLTTQSRHSHEPQHGKQHSAHSRHENNSIQGLEKQVRYPYFKE